MKGLRVGSLRRRRVSYRIIRREQVACSICTGRYTPGKYAAHRRSQIHRRAVGRNYHR